MGDVVTRLATVTHAGFTEINGKINALVDAQIRTEESLTRTEVRLVLTEVHLDHTEEKFNRLEANVAQTTKNLNKLITVVDRYLTGRNGF
jgi:uncharacterized protein YqgV (UPF0045/DUF77 family)